MSMQESFERGHEQRIRTGKQPLKKDLLPKSMDTFEGMDVFRGHGPEEIKARIEAEHGSEHAKAFQTVLDVCEEIKYAGGRALLVGGSVRDEVLGATPNDFDVEVYGLTPERIESIARRHGKIQSVGKAFGIFILSNEGSTKIDLSLPRKDSISGESTNKFANADPYMSIKDAARRRDFTCNALAKNPLTGEIFDPFGGVADLQKRLLRVTDKERFPDDPVRVLRGAQFVARFGLRVDPDSYRIMSKLIPKIAKEPTERILPEWDKLLMKSDMPSMGLMFLRDVGVIDALYPELNDLQGTPQEFEWHPEGGVWIHNLMVVDAAARVAREQQLNQSNKRVVMYGALCHDLAKPSTTEWDFVRLRSRGHEPAGEKPTRAFLERIGMDKETIEKVVAIVKKHLWPGTTYRKHLKGEHISDGSLRKLATSLHPATIAELTFVAQADHEGRGPFLDPAHPEQFLLPFPYKAGVWVRQRAEQLGIYQQKPEPILQGRDLLTVGFKPSKKDGPKFGQIIALADQLRDEQGLTRDEILALIAVKNIDQALEALKTTLQTKTSA